MEREVPDQLGKHILLINHDHFLLVLVQKQSTLNLMLMVMMLRM
jgi:hypothetical protein